jgi:mannosyltransferase OCH1-like enzyme
MIPPILHFIWYQGGELPEYVKRNIERAKEVCCGFDVMIWDSQMIADLECNSGEVGRLYNLYSYDIERIDLAKLMILKEFGGFYLDVDIYLLKSVELLLNRDFYICREKISTVGNAVIGSSVGFEFIDYLIKGYLKMIRYNHPDKLIEVLNKTGPKLITKLMKPYMKYVDKSVRFYPKAWVRPNTEIVDTEQQYGEESFGVHLWYGLWR